MKIEGRGRSPEYVSVIVKTYKQALRDIEQGKYTKEKIKEYYKKLETVFNRRLSHGNYYLGKEMGEYSDAYGSKATEEKEFVGKITHYFRKASVAEIEITSGTLAKEDHVYITGIKTGVLRQPIGELRDVNEKGINEASKGDVVTFPVSEKVRINDKVYIIRKRNNIN
jgi:putative protease